VVQRILPSELARAEALILTGKTYDNKEAIKARGGRWDPDRHCWRVPVGRSLARRKVLSLWCSAHPSWQRRKVKEVRERDDNFGWRWDLYGEAHKEASGGMSAE
jgi:hypothetical protein